MTAWIGHFGLAGAAQALLLAVVIISVRGGNGRANLLLAGFLILESLKLFGLFVLYEPVTMSNRVALLWLPLSVLSGPALYLYIKALAESEFRFRPIYLLHLSPWLAVLAMIGLLQDWSSGPESMHAASSRRGGEGGGTAPLIFTISGVILIGYMIAARLCLKQHYERMQQALSSLKNVSLDWLNWLVLAGLVFRGGQLAFMLLSQFTGFDIMVHDIIDMTGNLLFLYIVSLGGLRQPLIFSQDIYQALAELEADKYRKTGIDAEQSGALWGQLQKWMATEQPYLDPDLNLSQLAGYLDQTNNVVSMVLNHHAGCSLYQYINGLRVEKAQEMLVAPEWRKRKFLEIGMEVGFNSQSTFYKHFKNRTGLTPQQYRQQSASP